VRVITGRGRHSAGPPVLRGEIEDLLGSLKPDLVEEYTLDPWRGAFLVELSRRGSPPSPPRVSDRPPRTPEEAELRRKALEALAELGIQPTAELLAAEIRRLRAAESSSQG
jgi:hypothetical protein